MEEQVARIRRLRAASEAFAAEQRALTRTALMLLAECETRAPAPTLPPVAMWKVMVGAAVLVVAVAIVGLVLARLSGRLP